MSQPSPSHQEQQPNADLIQEQKVPLEKVNAQEGAHEETKFKKKHLITIRPIYTPMTNVTSMSKWYTHDQFTTEN